MRERGPRCRSCEAAIAWCLTPAGKNMPVDAEPADDGNLVIEADRVGDPVVIAYDPAKHAGRERFKSHFATCPQGTQWRNKQQSLL